MRRLTTCIDGHYGRVVAEFQAFKGRRGAFANMPLAMEANIPPHEWWDLVGEGGIKDVQMDVTRPPAVTSRRDVTPPDVVILFNYSKICSIFFLLFWSTTLVDCYKQSTSKIKL
jgi:hypothetical protein